MLTAARAFAFLSLLLLLSQPTSAAPRYAVTDLGLLPEVSDEVALSLNASGQVAGWQEQSGIVHAALWKDGKPKIWDAPPGFTSSLARAVNDRGQAAGWATSSRNLVDSLATTHACRFEPGGQVTDLGTLGGRDSQAFGINAAGQVVGGSLRADGSRHAFLFTTGKNTVGKMADLGTLPGGKFSLAYAISDAGAVVGISETAHAEVHACLWQSGRVTDLGTLPGGHTSLGFAVNHRGVAAGAAMTDSDCHAVLYAQGAVRDLGTLGSDPATVSGLNNRGQAVGASNLSTILRHAFLWESGRMTDLNTLVSSASGWTLLSATAINERGQIVGTARHPHSRTYAVLLTPLSLDAAKKMH